MKVSTVEIESASVEALIVRFRSVTDPTGDTVEFSISSPEEVTPSGTWVTGVWSTDYPWDGSRATAITPTVGSTGAALSLTEGVPALLWSRVAGAIIDRAARIVVR